LLDPVPGIEVVFDAGDGGGEQLEEGCRFRGFGQVVETRVKFELSSSGCEFLLFGEDLISHGEELLDLGEVLGDIAVPDGEERGDAGRSKATTVAQVRWRKSFEANGLPLASGGESTVVDGEDG